MALPKIFPIGLSKVETFTVLILSIITGPDCTVDPTVASTITQFHAAKKPLAFCCIAPHLAAKLIPGCTVTVGSAG